MTDVLDLDAFWLERPDLRPPEDLVLKAMAQMGVADPQADLFATARPESAAA